MKIFECSNCGNGAYFDNTACVHCGAGLGYMPERFEMAAQTAGADRWGDGHGRHLRLCANAGQNGCNWLLPEDDGQPFCLACRYNRTVPDLSVPGNPDNWRKIEAAKRHLFYSLTRWRLPMPNRELSPEQGLAFDFLADVQNPDGSVETVLTGHQSGLITINIAEGDDAERERRRTLMGEPYRTLLGHFRHEIGHYYWLVLVSDNPSRFRRLFGDERQDYAEALQRHHANGAPAGWQASFISAYATAHPWEDFAETWAHFIHMVDTVETAQAFCMRVRHPDGLEAGAVFDPYAVTNVDDLIQAFVPLTLAINAVNRSMGQPDLYPFVLSAPVIEKLQFICDIVHRRAGN